MTAGTDADRRVVYGALFAQSLMASGTHIVARVIAQQVDAFTLTLVRSLIAAALMGGIVLLRVRRPVFRREDMRLLLSLSFLAIPVNQFLFLLGMRYTIPSNAALLYATTPLFVLLFSRLFLREPMSRRKIAGVALGFVGVTIVIFERGYTASMDYLFGNVMVFLAVLAWALYTVYGKRLIHQYGSLQASASTLIIGTLLFLPIGLIPAIRFPYETLSATGWMQILYLAVITSVLSYFLWYYALARAEAGKVALFTNLQPVLTTLLAVLLLGQTITVKEGGGIVQQRSFGAAAAPAVKPAATATKAGR